MPNVNVYFSKTDIALGNAPTQIVLTEVQTILREYDLKSYTNGQYKFYAFTDDLSADDECVITPFLIPKYFDQNTTGTDIHGMFIVSIGLASRNPAAHFVADKTVGQFGCPKRVLKKQSDKSFFTFNNMRFYPFVNTDFTIGYYICDNSTPIEPRHAWPLYVAIEDGVSLDYPMQYDATLGLYLTRAAHIEMPLQP
ncbi:MAG: hypothetical protein WDO14_06320 [Bacteroidota bacterium]